MARTLCPPELAFGLSRPKRTESRRAQLELALLGTVRVSVSCESSAPLNFSLHVHLLPDFYLLYAPVPAPERSPFAEHSSRAHPQAYSRVSPRHAMPRHATPRHATHT